RPFHGRSGNDAGNVLCRFRCSAHRPQPDFSDPCLGEQFSWFLAPPAFRSHRAGSPGMQPTALRLRGVLAAERMSASCSRDFSYFCLYLDAVTEAEIVGSLI